MKPYYVDELEPVWRALANPMRRQILDLLMDGPLTTGQLSDHFNAHSRFAVMQHLGVLEQGGLVIQRKKGRQRFNYLNPAPIEQIHDRWVSRYRQAPTESLASPSEVLGAEESDNSPRPA